MIKNAHSYRIVTTEVRMFDNSSTFPNEVVKLLKHGKTPLISAIDTTLWEEPPVNRLDRVGLQSVYVGTASNIDEYGIRCENVGRVGADYFSKDGKLVIEDGEYRRSKWTILDFPMTGLDRVRASLRLWSPRGIFDEYGMCDTIQGKVLIQHQDIKEPAPVEGSILLGCEKKKAFEDYKKILTLIAAER